jgi:hypothetical protein
MPYIIEKLDKLREEIVRIATEQVESTLDELSDPEILTATKACIRHAKDSRKYWGL